jgi:benzoate/toluate 1,2-dioxygenase alpha subunit
MTKFTNDKLRSFIQDGRVHRSIYLDPDIFNLEMERIYHHTWLYVGHESQVPEPGDFYCTIMGRQPVIMSRYTDGKVYVIHNSCGHRGTKVVNEETGNAKRFRCPYHGWTYETDGRLRVVPMRDLYPLTLDLDDPRYSMRQLPRVESYHGFIFASLSPDVPDLMAYFGGMKAAIDEMIARAPEGAVELIGGVQRYEFRGNWKFQTENVGDQYHTAFTHESSASSDGYQVQRRAGESGSRTRLFDDAGEVVQHDDGTWAYPQGHSSIGAMHIDGEQSGGAFDVYRAMLVEKYGEDGTADVLKLVRHAGFFYPNFDLHHMGQFIRVFRPLAVDRTEVLAYPIHLKGSPIELFHEVIRVMNLSHSPPALAHTDDLEIFERCQMGLVAENDEWITFARGQGQDVPDPTRGAMFGPRTSEIAMRNQHQVWLEYMTAT